MITFKTTLLSLSTIVLLGLSGCGSSSGDSTPAVVQEQSSETELQNNIDSLLSPTAQAEVADAKNMFAQLRESAVTFVDLESAESNSSTIVGSQYETIQGKIQPAVEAISSDFESSVTALESSAESFQTAFEADFKTTLTSINSRMDALFSQTNQFAEDQNWSVTEGSDILSYTYTDNGDGTGTDVITLNSKSLTVTHEVNNDGDKKPVAASGSVTLTGTGYNLALSEITLTSTGAKVVASGTINGDNSAVMTLSGLNISTTIDSSVVNSLNTIRNVTATFDGTITAAGRSLVGSLKLSESSMFLSGNYTGISTEPSLDGNITLNTSFNSLIDDASEYGDSDIDPWNAVLMVTFSDGTKSLVTSYTHKDILMSQGMYVGEFNLTTQSGKNVTVETNTTGTMEFNSQYGYYSWVSETNTVKVSDGATVTPYYTYEDKLTAVIDGKEMLIKDAYYYYFWNASENFMQLRMNIDYLDGYSGENNVSDIVQTPNKNLLDRVFDAKFNGEITHGSKKIVASVGVKEDALESSIYAQDIKVTDGESEITLDKLSLVLPNADFLKLTKGQSSNNNKSKFENYTINYDEYYNSNSENDLDIKNILEAELSNLQVVLYDTENEILTVDANISLENRTKVNTNFDGVYEYRGTKFVGHVDFSGTVQEQTDTNSDTQLLVDGEANVLGSIEANGFKSFDIKTNLKVASNNTFEGYVIFTRDSSYELGIKAVQTLNATSGERTVEVTLGDSNGVLGNLKTTYSDNTQNQTTPTLNITDKSGTSLATYGEDGNGNEWEIVYTDNTSETLF